MKRILWLFVIMTSLGWATLPLEIAKYMNASKIPRKDISIFIQNLNTGKVVAEHYASRTHVPASVIKLYTTYAALHTLGSNFKWPTKFYYKGRLSGGILKGDLIVKGYGDPTLSSKHLPSIVKQIKRKGIRRITGNIIIDRSFFNVGNQNSANFDENRHSPYNAMPDAMMFNERVSTVYVNPKRRSVTKATPDSSYRVVNKIRFVNKRCRGSYAWPRVKVSGDSKLLLSGRVSKRCGVRKISKVLTKPYKSFYYALKSSLKRSGVDVGGTLKVRRLPKGARPLFTHYAKPLKTILSKTNKKSNNLYARHLLLYLGAKVYGAPTTTHRGRKAVEKIIRNSGGMGGGSFYIDNGSGLSRNAKLNAKMVGVLLEDAYDAYGAEWMKTLAIGGIDGTIKKRFRGTSAHGRAFMKTGTLKRVKNIAGYVKSRDGNLYSVTVLVSSRVARYRANKLQTQIIQWLATSRSKRKSLTHYVSKSPQIYKRPKETKVKKTVVQKRTKHPYPYSIQVGVYKIRPTRHMLRKAKGSGYSVTVKKEGRLYKVFVGKFSSRAMAQKSLRSIQRRVNGSAFIVKR
jgi:D-alanyl-D-alanine carboxypeptidase/D-alanyl-D-alanine-endopeptidase (penicillin-binding protein 4)